MNSMPVATVATRATAGAPEHLLLTVLGTNPREGCYMIGDKKLDTRLAPVALFDLLPRSVRPARVLALCTAEAERDSWPLLEASFVERCAVQRVEIPSGSAQTDVNAFLNTLTEAVPEGADLTVDVTHGLRHFSFLTYAGVLYLAALRRVNIRGAYYGLWKKKPEPSPFFDLRPLLELPRWVHALEVLRETGSALPMAALLDNGPANQLTRACARDLEHLSTAYLSGLPLEVGRQARNIRGERRKPLLRLLKQYRLPLAGKLIDLLDEVLHPFAFANPVSGDGWKKTIGLTAKELRRQAGLVDELLHRGSRTAAFGLMSEWTVSWTAWMRGNQRNNWLEFHTVRKSATTLLGAMAAAYADSALRGLLTEEQRALGAFWHQLAELRNGYAHHGMRPQPLVDDKKLTNTQREVVRYWKILKALPDFRLSLGDSSGGKILVSPIGQRPGVLFSALHACRADSHGQDPHLSLVICSPETKDMITDALQRAEYAGEVEPYLLGDAFGGSCEVEGLAQAARRRIFGASEVLVNVTGGTTLMGLAAETLADEARALACPVRRFGLIDRRPPSEQDADPYRAGEPFWLDARAGDDH